MRFRPSTPMTLLLFLSAVVFSGLGSWQLGRMGEKQSMLEQFESAPSLAVEQAIARGQAFSRVQATGQYDARRHVLLDNRILRGRAGVHVLTPFTLTDGRVLLVNRGWLPMRPDRSRLPEFSTTRAGLTIKGILSRPPGGGPRLGEPDRLESDRWPQLVTYLELGAVGRALGQELPSWIVLLDRDDPTGFAGRDWKPFVMGPEKHGAYALQWFSLAAAAIVIWVVTGIRRAGGGDSPGT